MITELKRLVFGSGDVNNRVRVTRSRSGQAVRVVETDTFLGDADIERRHRREVPPLRHGKLFDRERHEDCVRDVSSTPFLHEFFPEEARHALIALLTPRGIAEDTAYPRFRQAVRFLVVVGCSADKVVEHG